jgi:HTH-type transcriptional regulator / antitoxin HigA
MEGTAMKAVKSHSLAKGRQDENRYLELVRRFPLRPIRTKREYAAATKVLERLVIRGDDDLNQDELDYVDVLTNLVETYDVLHLPELGEGTPLERLKWLVESAGMSTADLGRILGNSGLGSQVMLGRRELSKAHIRLLSQHFKLDADYFL